MVSQRAGKRKFTPKHWERIEAGYATMIYGPNGERVCKVIDNKDDADLIENVHLFLDIINQVYNSLPTNRDWLDPTIEKTMKKIIEEFL